MFDVCVFKQTIDDSMGINWTLLLDDLLHYSYEKYFIQRLLKKSENSLTRSYDFTLRYMFFHTSLNSKIYRIGLEINGTTDTARSAS